VVACDPLNVCTIIAKNYVAYARVLARSIAEQHPGSRLWTLVIDDCSEQIDPAREPFELLAPADIGCEPFMHMALAYTVLELSTAVKPWLLRHLLRETGGPVTYLDPDIKVYGSLARMDELADRHGVVLTPHNTEPIPQDGRRPSQVDIMIAGVYNLGCVTVADRPEVDLLLDWWAERLERDCRVDPTWGYFVDQRWFDLAPGFMSDVAILRDPAYNVAYWNLHSRKIGLDGSRYLVDGRPLAFFHFSGFDPDHPLVLSRYQDRIDVVGDAALERILAEYAAEVNGAGHADSRKWPYTYDMLGDGSRVEHSKRFPLGPLYEDFAQAQVDAEGGAPSPFTAVGATAFTSFITAQAPTAPPGVSRLLARVYDEREDLRGVFPDLAGVDRDGLLLWAHEYGAYESPLLAAPVVTGNGAGAGPSTPASEGSPDTSGPPSPVGAPDAGAPLRDARWGVNVVGYFRSELGTGEAARQVIRALDAQAIPALPIHGQTIPLNRQGHSYVTAAPEDACYPVNLICMNADMLPEFAGQAGPDFFAGRYSIGLWFWEVSRFPDRWRDSFALLEEVWAPTAHVASALESLATVPVSTVRIPVQVPELEPRSRAELGMPEDKFVFLFSFDYLSVFRRKNPLALIEAFTRAFTPGDGAALVLKCINGDRDPESHGQLMAAAGRHPDIEVIDRYLSPNDNGSLTAACDCYVSLHRAEGFGLGMAEAMWHGKPVIATGYSGNLDFMTPSNSLLVDHRLVPIGAAAGPYPPEGVWADPDVEHAAALMRGVFDDQPAAVALGRTAASDIRRTHSPDAAGALMLRRLESIRATGRVRRAVDPARRRPRSLAALSLQLRQGPVPARAERARAARELMRQTALRLMRPFTAYQEQVNRQVLTGLEEVTDGMASLRDGELESRARLVGELRGSEAWPVDGQGGDFGEIKRMIRLQADRGLYLSLAELARRHAAVSAQAGDRAGGLALTPFELRVFSQNGEDGVLAEILRRTGVSERFFVEFGVESGREGNCVYLADVAGWRGLFMEADDDLYRSLDRKYAAQPAVRTIMAQVAPENVEDLFRRAGVPAEPDVLSIDVDGQDYWIWRAISSFRPRVVVVEYNSALDPRRRLVQPYELSAGWQGTDYFGASLGALQALADSKGYRLVHAELSGVNAFFVRADLAADAFPDPADVALRGVPNYFQTGYSHPPDTSGGPYIDLDDDQRTISSQSSD
jgi:glycosyltransferase involved in cell wall biosynthesis